jgi:hypothetical protein
MGTGVTWTIGQAGTCLHCGKPRCADPKIDSRPLGAGKASGVDGSVWDGTAPNALEHLSDVHRPADAEDGWDEDAAIGGVPQALMDSRERRRAEVIGDSARNPAVPRPLARWLSQLGRQCGAEKAHAQSEAEPPSRGSGLRSFTAHGHIIDRRAQGED